VLDNLVLLRDSQTAPTQVFEMSDLPTQTYDESTFQLLSGKKLTDNEDISTLCYDLDIGVVPNRHINDQESSANSQIATQVVDDSSGKPTRHLDDLHSSLTSSLGATQVFDVGQHSSRSDSQSDLTATQVFDVAAISQPSGSFNLPIETDATETQVLSEGKPEEGVSKEGGSDTDGKRMTFSPQSSSTQALSETENSFPHLELDLSECNNGSMGRRSSTTCGGLSECASKVLVWL